MGMNFILRIAYFKYSAGTNNDVEGIEKCKNFITITPVPPI